MKIYTLNKILSIVILVVCITFDCLAQFDTTCYRQYPEKLVITLFQSVVREHDIRIKQSQVQDFKSVSTLDYASQAKNFTGLSFDYDIFGLSIGVNTFPSTDTYKKGVSKNTNVAFSLGTNKVAFEASYRNYKGFYEKNSANYVLGFNDNTPYIQNQSMKYNGIKLKTFYYVNHQKFSYKSAYSCTHRQLKSAWSPVFLAGAYYNNLSTDSSFIPKQIQLPYYRSMKELTNINVTGISCGLGASANIIFLKNFFFNSTLLFALESQWRNYDYFNGTNSNGSFAALGGDFRFSLGYNAENFMCYLSAMYDFSKWNNSTININNQFISAQLNLAYRFNVEKPKWYHKIEDSKVYKLF